MRWLSLQSVLGAREDAGFGVAIRPDDEEARRWRTAGTSSRADRAAADKSRDEAAVQKLYARPALIAPLALLAALLVPRGAGQADTLSYKVYEKERAVDLSTPYGPREIIGNVGTDTARYHVEIPLQSLKPTPTPSPSPGPAKDADVDAAGAADAGDAKNKETVREITKEKEKEKSKKSAMGGDGTGKGDDPGDDDDEPNELGETPVKPRPRKHLPSPIDPGYEYDDSDRLVLEANHLFNHGKYYEATLYVEELIRKKPTYVKAWLMKGSLMWVQGYKDLAKNAWQQALAIEPDNQEIKDLLQRYR